jgi:predicted DCC family thiol-disulfide oxidoreductase YuxK
MSATLIYDGDCPLCCAARDWVDRNAVAGAFEFLKCQSDERAERFPEINFDQCMTAMQLVYPDGRHYSGDEALPQICLGLRKWRWMAKLLAVPPISTLSPYVYRYIARNRQTFSILIARKPPESCPAESADELSR